MRITFIGTSHGLPEPNRKCACTLITIGSGSEARNYFIDMGTQAIEGLTDRGIAPDSVKAMFFTHAHGDHTDGLVSFVDLISWYYRNSKPTFFVPDIRFRDVLKAWGNVTGDDMREDLEFFEVKDGEIYDDGFIKVTAYPTQHARNSHAFLVEAEGKHVLFTGDIAHPNCDFPLDAVKDITLDALVAESAHFACGDYAEPISKCHVKKMFINHYSEGCYLGTLKELRNNLKDIPIRLATDNYEVEL